MASITKKNINGHTYYYARECQRVNGKPKIVWQKYLGKSDHVIKSVLDKKNASPITTPDETIISQFGAVAAIYDIARRWGIADIIDSVVEKRNQGLSVGNYMLIAAINRCVSPKSKNKIGDWFWDTPLRRWIPVKDKRTLTSQRFWDNMVLLDADTIREAEKRLTQALIQEFKIDTACLLYDTTNFITYIDTFNEENTVAQRGKGKQAGGKFRIVGLALLVSSDFHIPLFHEAYQGNTHDCKEFDSVVDRLMQRYKILSQEVDNITLVFDKGNNSKNNFDKLATTPYHFVGSLKLNDNGVDDLLDIPLTDYTQMKTPQLQGVWSYRLRRNIFGHLRTLVITYNEELFLTQSQTILRDAQKRTVTLKKMAITLSRWLSGDIKNGKKPTVNSVQDKINDILKGQYMKLLIKTDITTDNGYPILSYSFDHKAIDEISRKRLGKTVLFTDNDSWGDADIILAYRGQFGIENAFKTMKDPHFVSWSPMWHWTDHSVRVHAFYCVLALSLIALLQRELYKHGFHFSIPAAIDLLSNITEVLMINHRQPQQGTKNNSKKQWEPVPQIVISKMDNIQQDLFKALRLERFTEAKV